LNPKSIPPPYCSVLSHFRSRFSKATGLVPGIPISPLFETFVPLNLVRLTAFPYPTPSWLPVTPAFNLNFNVDTLSPIKSS